MNKPIIAACLMGASGAVVFLILPLLVGLFIDDSGLSEDQAGVLASSYFFTYLLASASSVRWSRQITSSTASLLAYGFMSVGLALAAFTNSHLGLGICMATAGIGGGMLFSLAVSIISSIQHCDKYFGWLLVSQQLLAALVLSALPLWVIPHWGLQGTLLLLGGIGLIFATSSRWAIVPQISPGGKEQERNSITQAPGPVFIGLLMLAIHFAGLSALWAFVERIGVANGLPSDSIGSALSLSMLGGLIGALAVAWIGDRYGRGGPVAMSTLAFVLVCICFALSLNWVTFAAVTALLSLAWNFFLAYQMSIISELDQGGRRSLLIPAAQGLGAVLGPASGGLLWNAGGANVLLLMAGSMCVLAGFVFWTLQRRSLVTRTV